MKTPTDPIRIILADPHRAFAEALSDRLNREPGFDVAGTATRGSELVSLAERVRPRVVLSELEFADREILMLAGDLARTVPQARIVLLSGVLADVFAEQSARLGLGYLLKTEPISAIIAAVHQAAAGGLPLSAEVAERLTFDPAAGRNVLKTEDRLAGLTARQIEVLRHIARGRSVREVARDLGLTEKGVDSHKYRIMNRLGIRDRVGLARYAIREGVLQP